MAVADDPGGSPAGLPASPDPGGPAARPSARESAKHRLEQLRERAVRTRAGIEARRADSASIDTAFEAVERDAQTGGGVLAAALAFRLFMFLVPYAFVMVTGFGLASSAAGQDPGDAARSAGIGGLLANAVASTSTLSLWNRIVALVVGGFALALTARSLVRVLWIVHRLIWRVVSIEKPSEWGAPVLVGITTVLFGIADLAAWLGSQSFGFRVLALVLTAVVRRRRLVPGLVVDAPGGLWVVGAPPRGGDRRRGGGGAAPPHPHLRRPCRLAEVRPLRRDRDRPGAAALDLLRRPPAHGVHRRQCLIVEAPHH